MNSNATGTTAPAFKPMVDGYSIKKNELSDPKESENINSLM